MDKNCMRKTLAVGILSAALVAVPFAGVSLAAAGPHPTAQHPTAQQPSAQPSAQPSRQPSTPQPAAQRPDARRGVLKAAVAPGKVAAGKPYKVTIDAPGARNGTIATVKSPQGATSKVTLKNGKAAKTLTVPAGARPGTYKVTVTVAGKSTTASFTVVRRASERPGGAEHDRRR